MVLVFGRMRERRSILQPFAHPAVGKRHLHESGGFVPGHIPTTVTASGRYHAFTTDHLLDRRQISTSVTLSRREVRAYRAA